MMDVGRSSMLHQRVLDAMTVRARTAQHNIANQNTPGFKRYVVDFEDRLRTALEEGTSVEALHPVVTRDQSGGPGINNVVVGDEFAVLNKVQFIHELFTYRLASQFERLQKAIGGRS